MHELIRFLIGVAAIICFSFGAVGLLMWLVSLAQPGARPESSWVGRATRPLAPLFTRLGMAQRQFGSEREAMDYLAGVIAAEAQRQAIPFSEIERKMLYHSKTSATLPDMAEVSAEFHRTYNQEQFERKIFVLERKIAAHRHFHNALEKEEWDRAVGKLNEGDHYLRLLLNPSQTRAQATVESPQHVLKLWVIAVVVVLCLAAIVVLGNVLLARRF